jgi:hypothetical protein
MTKELNKHLFLNLSRDLLVMAKSTSQIIPHIKIPNRQFPKPVFVYNDKFICVGYFVSFEEEILNDQIFEMCKNGRWNELANKIADFIIISIDCNSHKLNILTSHSGKFPCFYSIENNQIVISTSFHLVDETLKNRTLDIGEAVELVTWSQALYPREETLYKQIRQLPLATLLTVNSDFNVTTEPLLLIEEILENGRALLFLDEKDFIDEFERTIKIIMNDYLRAIDGVEFSTDLSSGLDSSLVTYWLKKLTHRHFVCHSMFSPLIYEDSDPEIVNKFSKIHGLTTKFIDITEQYPFTNLDKIDNAKHDFYVTDYALEKVSYALNYISDSGRKEIALFTGHGGDELYYSSALENTLRFGVQQTYFDLSDYSKTWLSSVLTPKGIEILMDKKRFLSKRNYPSPSTYSVSVLGQMYFPLFWESGVWPLTPLDDPRLMNVFRRMPKSLQGKKDTKLKLCSLMQDVFVKEQFVPKSGPDKLRLRFLTEKKDLVISVLKKSILGYLGLVKNLELIDKLKKEDSALFTDLAISISLQALTQLEIFLQKSDL